MKPNVENNFKKPCSEFMKPFSCSTQLIKKFILLINFKMPTLVGILIFISRIRFMLFLFSSKKKKKKGRNCWHFGIYKHDKILADLKMRKKL